MLDKSDGTDVDNAVAIHSWMIAANAVQEVQESQAASAELVEDEKKAMSRNQS